MQQMCPVQYTYSMLGKYELYHVMKKNCLTCYDSHKRGIQEFSMSVVCNNTEQCKSAQTTQRTKFKNFQ